MHHADARIPDYVDNFIKVSYNTIMAMVERKPIGTTTCCIFNPVGGGAFLRGVCKNPSIEAMIYSMIPCMLSVAKRMVHYTLSKMHYALSTEFCLVLTGYEKHVELYSRFATRVLTHRSMTLG